MNARALIRSPWSILVGFCLLIGSALFLAAGCGDKSGTTPTPEKLDPAAIAAAHGAPHIGRPDAGFVGPAACLKCHENEHASWHRSYHRTMTQVASPESVKAPFDGLVLTNRGRSFELRQSPDGFFVRMQDPELDYGRPGQRRGSKAMQVERRVVMVTGSHHMQVYWVEGASPEREHFILPFAYLLPEQRWVPREDAFVVPPDADFMHAMWNDNCIRCHATAGQPRRSMVTGRFDTRVAELGISCEACHGPGGDHVAFHELPENKDAPAHAITQPLSLPIVAQAQVCGQCHAITGPHTQKLDTAWFWGGYPYRAGGDLWETRGISRHPAKASKPAPRTPPQNFRMAEKELDFFFWADGQVRVAGREYNGLLESACYQHGDMTCLTCHSLHDSDPNDQLRRDRPIDDVCADCHEEIAADITAHTHHGVSSSGSSCVNCHMPHSSYGLYSAIRSHEISSPSVGESLPPVGRPNACNLCHLDQTLAWTATHMEKWYAQKAPALPEAHQTNAASLLWLLQGDAGQRALLSWHFGWDTAQQASGSKWLVPALSVAAASDPYRAVRMVATRSLKTFPELEGVAIDFLAPQEERTSAGKAVYQRWLEGPRPPAEKRLRVGMLEDGSADLQLFVALQRTRDNRPVFLGE